MVQKWQMSIISSYQTDNYWVFHLCEFMVFPISLNTFTKYHLKILPENLQNTNTKISNIQDVWASYFDRAIWAVAFGRRPFGSDVVWAVGRFDKKLTLILVYFVFVSRTHPNVLAHKRPRVQTGGALMFKTIYLPYF